MKEKKSYFSNLWAITKKTGTEWMKADPFRQSAVVAYYAVFSIPALLVIVIAVAGLVFGQDAVRGEISEQVKSALGNDTAESVENIIANASRQKTSVIATIIGFVTLILGSTGVFAELQTSLNQIWEVKVVSRKKWLRSIKTKLFSFGLVLSIGFLMLVSLLITAGLEALSGKIKDHLSDITLIVFKILNFVIPFGVITVLFALIFKILPDVKIKLRDVWMGAMVTSLLFILGKFALGIYFAKSNPASAYGAAGSIVLIMLWVSYSGMILFFGAEFTKQHATFYRHKIEPANGAEMIDKENPKNV